MSAAPDRFIDMGACGQLLFVFRGQIRSFARNVRQSPESRRQSIPLAADSRPVFDQRQYTRAIKRQQILFLRQPRKNAGIETGGVLITGNTRVEIRQHLKHM